MNPNPAEMTVADRAAQFTYWHTNFTRLGIVPVFSDDPPGVIWFPLSVASGPAEVNACEKLGTELLAYAARRRATLAGLTPAPTPPPPRAGAPVPAAERELAAAEIAGLDPDAARIAALEEELARMKQLMGGEAEPHQFTTPTPNERKPAPVVR